jgi:hypothetical protein
MEIAKVDFENIQFVCRYIDSAADASIANLITDGLVVPSYFLNISLIDFDFAALEIANLRLR